MKIITTVGTSLLTNVIIPLKNRCNINDEEQLAIKAFTTLQNKDFSEKNKYKKEYDFLKNFALKYISFNEKTSAEIKSILALRNKYKNQFLEIELIATDTLLSPLCSEVLQDLIEENLENIKVNFSNNNIIKDLQVSDYNKYKKGLINLLDRLNDFTYGGEYFGDILLNITGGFKGVIPYMTIYGQINNIPLFYIFEFTNALIEIPQIPITLNEKLFDKYWREFYKISNDLINKDNLSYEFIKEASNLIEIEDNYVYINALGKILWDKYKNEHLIFYTTDDIYEEILKQKNIKKILKEKFLDTYKNKTEIKNSHYVYDDGNNPYRIFYFEENGSIYIYKTFEDHDKYEKYINSIFFDKDKFKKEAKLFKI